ncbi:hypothetical protein ACFL58_04855, partial [Elusimicrobiota bacterium]
MLEIISEVSKPVQIEGVAEQITKKSAKEIAELEIQETIKKYTNDQIRAIIEIAGKDFMEYFEDQSAEYFKKLRVEQITKLGADAMDVVWTTLRIFELQSDNKAVKSYLVGLGKSIRNAEILKRDLRDNADVLKREEKQALFSGALPDKEHLREVENIERVYNTRIDKAEGTYENDVQSEIMKAIDSMFKYLGIRAEVSLTGTFRIPFEEAYYGFADSLLEKAVGKVTQAAQAKEIKKEEPRRKQEPSVQKLAIQNAIRASAKLFLQGKKKVVKKAKPEVLSEEEEEFEVERMQKLWEEERDKLAREKAIAAKIAKHITFKDNKVSKIDLVKIKNEFYPKEKGSFYFKYLFETHGNRKVITGSEITFTELFKELVMSLLPANQNKNGDLVVTEDVSKALGLHEAYKKNQRDPMTTLRSLGKAFTGIESKKIIKDTAAERARKAAAKAVKVAPVAPVVSKKPAGKAQVTPVPVPQVPIPEVTVAALEAKAEEKVTIVEYLETLNGVAEKIVNTDAAKLVELFEPVGIIDANLSQNNLGSEENAEKAQEILTKMLNTLKAIVTDDKKVKSILQQIRMHRSTIINYIIPSLQKIEESGEEIEEAGFLIKKAPKVIERKIEGIKLGEVKTIRDFFDKYLPGRFMQGFFDQTKSEGQIRLGEENIYKYKKKDQLEALMYLVKLDDVEKNPVVLNSIKNLIGSLTKKPDGTAGEEVEVMAKLIGQKEIVLEEKSKDEVKPDELKTVEKIVFTDLETAFKNNTVTFELLLKYIPKVKGAKEEVAFSTNNLALKEILFAKENYEHFQKILLERFASTKKDEEVEKILNRFVLYYGESIVPFIEKDIQKVNGIYSKANQDHYEMIYKMLIEEHIWGGGGLGEIKEVVKDARKDSLITVLELKRLKDTQSKISKLYNGNHESIKSAADDALKDKDFFSGMLLLSTAVLAAITKNAYESAEDYYEKLSKLITDFSNARSVASDTIKEYQVRFVFKHDKTRAYMIKAGNISFIAINEAKLLLNKNDKEAKEALME